MTAGQPHTPRAAAAPCLECRTQTVAQLTGPALARKLDDLRLLIALRQSGFDGIEAY